MTITIDNRGNAPIAKSLQTTMKQAAIASLRGGFDPRELKTAEMSISLVTDEEIRELNKKYRELDKPTDVLSFPAADNEHSDEFFLGDIVISTDTAQAQAAEYNHTIERELAFLTIHGTLHLMGMNHELSSNDERLMIEMQDTILNEMGLTR